MLFFGISVSLRGDCSDFRLVIAVSDRGLCVATRDGVFPYLPTSRPPYLPTSLPPYLPLTTSLPPAWYELSVARREPAARL